MDKTNFNDFPDRDARLAQVFEAGREAIVPRRELLSEILTRVTEGVESGYTVARGTPKGRTSFVGEIAETMSTTWKVIVPVGAVVVLALIFIVSRLGNPSGTSLSLADMDREEADFERIASDLDATVAEEQAIAALDADLAAESSGKATAVAAPVSNNPLDLSAIEKEESSTADSDSSLNDISAEEENLKQLDSEL
mgnify:CR=1 FL=1